jgi:hypothetical protein
MTNAVATNNTITKATGVRLTAINVKSGPFAGVSFMAFVGESWGRRVVSLDKKSWHRNATLAAQAAGFTPPAA